MRTPALEEITPTSQSIPSRPKPAEKSSSCLIGLVGPQGLTHLQALNHKDQSRHELCTLFHRGVLSVQARNAANGALEDLFKSSRRTYVGLIKRTGEIAFFDEFYRNDC